MQINKFILLAAMSASVTNLAQAAEDKGPKGLSAAAEFGMIVTSGNSTNSTVNGKFSIENDVEQWLHKAKLSIVNSESENVTTAERYLLKLKSNYKLGEKQFLFGGLTHDVDKFSGYDYQTSIVAGYGRVIHDTDKYKLSMEIGPGYRNSKLKTGASDSEGILHLGAVSKYTINEATYIEANLNIDSGSDQTITELELGYVNSLTQSLALKVGYDLKNSSDVPAGTRKTDTITSVSLIYSF